MADDTIAAIATPAGRGGIGIIKISGEQAIPIAAALFRPAVISQGDKGADSSETRGLTSMASHRLSLGYISDSENDRIIDQVLVSIMRAPASYTREDVVEINTHGGPMAMQAILKLICAQGARLAEPGEFTRRAFLNGRIDLTQAEAVIDLINAKTERSLAAAAAQLDGQLQARIDGVRNAIMDVLAELEAGIDFPDEVEEYLDTARLADRVRKGILIPIGRLIRCYDEASIIRDGLRIAVVGKPNVGKSSLLNQMVQTDRAIVTEIPGTTRDVITESLNLKGIPVTISDTAGLHDSPDPVEVIGIQKTMEQVEGSDLVLFLVEANRPLAQEDLGIYDRIMHRPHIIVINKIDLINGVNAEKVLPSRLRKSPNLSVSALHGDGLDHLKDRILEMAGGENPIDQNAVVIPNLRHKKLLDCALLAANELHEGLENGVPPELLAVHAGEIRQTIEEILGISIRSDILERIFDRFCIGK